MHNHVHSPFEVGFGFEDCGDAGQGFWVGVNVQEFDDGSGIVLGLIGACGCECEGVAGNFAVGPHESKCVPDERIEPVEGLETCAQPDDGDVVSFEVAKFVEKDAAPLLRGKFTQHCAGNKQFGAEVSEQCR